ncbi:MAG: VPLPA-CTERM-specific exosortase XrtD [Gammaproteobacteria bacterium]|nr:VPLPA-CTERM-specific exosortase XrtD [Gammaproteobacteria bacterium]
MSEYYKTIDREVLRQRAPQLALCGLVLSGLVLMFYDGLEYMFRVWMTKEEYSHGLLLPLITLYILWQRKALLSQLPYRGSYLGVLVVCVGLMLGLMGELGTLYTAIQYGFLVAIFGIVLSVTGISTFKHYLFPLLILVFMVPLPSFIYNSLSSQLQLVSSQIGVAVIQLFDIPVYLQGNVIDLGKMKLQVVEACSGLRYLFPLSALAYILALMYQANAFLKGVVFLSSIPVTVAMNSLRIGLIGVTVDAWGKKAAEGVLHDFEGWVVFMSSLVIIIFEIRLLSWLMGDKRPLAEVLAVVEPRSAGEPRSMIESVGAKGMSSSSLRPFYFSAVVIIIFSAVFFYSPEREEIIPDRDVFATYPQDLGQWSGRRDYLNPAHLKALKLSDYLMINYSEQPGYPVNYYVAYYDSQQKGRSAHSPKSCMPGDGWEMSGFERTEIKLGNNFSLPVNRTVIRKGSQTSLVYYWFQQRGRVLNNEYLVKFYLLWDSITKQRTDGAMIRVTTPVFQHEGVEQADERIQKLIRESQTLLQSYVPG